MRSPVGVLSGGSSEKSSTGRTSRESIAAAKKPIPRAANADHTRSPSSRSLKATSASTIALRMSRNVGSPGASSMPPVTSTSATSMPSGLP